MPACSPQAEYRRPGEVDQVAPLVGCLAVELEGNPVHSVSGCWRICECSDGAKGPCPQQVLPHLVAGRVGGRGSGGNRCPQPLSRWKVGHEGTQRISRHPWRVLLKKVGQEEL